MILSALSNLLISVTDNNNKTSTCKIALSSKEITGKLIIQFLMRPVYYYSPAM